MSRAEGLVLYPTVCPLCGDILNGRHAVDRHHRTGCVEVTE